MTRIFLPPEELTSDNISITGDDARHISLVLRAEPGDTITVLDGQGKKYTYSILTVHKKEITAKKVSEEQFLSESPISITLAQSLPKGDKMDMIVQKATELGVSRIIPLITERSQVRTTEKLPRWRKIALSASKQSGRATICDISDTTDLKNFFSEIPDDAGRLIFYEMQENITLNKELNKLKGVKELVILIGPEGGFSMDEVMTASQNGFRSVSLGPRILRAETAPLTAISIIQYELGDIG